MKTLLAGASGFLGSWIERYLATGHNVTLVELFDRLHAITGRRPPLLRLPSSLGVPLADLAERLGILPAIDCAQAQLMGRTWWYDTTRATRDLGIGFRPLDETLRETVEWLTSAVSRPPSSADAASSADRTWDAG
jgi:dihydroflavonol-4-reductase